MKPASRRLPLLPSDLLGLSRLGVQGVLGVTDIVEAMHHTVLSRPAPLGRRPAGRTRGLTGFVYGAVRGATRGVGHALDLLSRLLPAGTTPAGPQRGALLAALNGVFGDHLADTGNPLAIPMQLRMGGRPWREALAAAEAPPCGRVLTLVHGLAMNDGQWNRRGHDHGQVLARALGLTPVYLHYNSGRHVSQNGRDFAAALADLVAHWPVPVTELMIVGHSMGGLVARSACHQAGGSAWLKHLSRLVFLGTPHQGAPLERGGRLVDAAARRLAPMPPRWRAWARRAAPASPTCATAICRTPTGGTAAGTSRPATTAGRRRCRAAWPRLRSRPPPPEPCRRGAACTTGSWATAWCRWPARWANTPPPRCA
jgi:hypothetical protein